MLAQLWPIPARATHRPHWFTPLAQAYPVLHSVVVAQGSESVWCPVNAS